MDLLKDKFDYKKLEDDLEIFNFCQLAAIDSASDYENRAIAMIKRFNTDKLHKSVQIAIECQSKLGWLSKIKEDFWSQKIQKMLTTGD